MRDPSEHEPMIGCLLLVGIVSAGLFIAATIIHFIGFFWLFAIILGIVVFVLRLTR